MTLAIGDKVRLIDAQDPINLPVGSEGFVAKINSYYDGEPRVSVQWTTEPAKTKYPLHRQDLGFFNRRFERIDVTCMNDPRDYLAAVTGETP